MAVRERFIDRAVRVLAAVALLMAVTCSPIRPARGLRTRPTRDPLSRNLELRNNEHCAPSGLTARRSLRGPDALQSNIAEGLDAEIEDEVTLKSSPAFVSIDILPSPCPEHHSDSFTFTFALETRPLRC